MCEQCEELFNKIGRKFDLDGHTIKVIIDAFIEEKSKIVQEQTGLTSKELSEALKRSEDEFFKPEPVNPEELNNFMDFLSSNGLVAADPKKKKDDDFVYN